ncbi:hypothetical protein [Flavobacterium sp. LC2016-01]|uniref:hypothetical protein n=1 Tax=Flavobacterium sp. LC2016-01 TaxID=2675876 RepID=UPI0012BAFBF4|nr:hypothetical protein [Flavobacterium sp. LC2016-01]MTH16403.1 hypothetical protein [Flavobacterium sp. LC2016-01]
MKKIFILSLLLIKIGVYSQNRNLKDIFNKKIIQVTGDLNKDNLLDKVVVTQDTINEKSPYKLEIFFAKPNGSFELIVSSTKIIEAQYPDGRDGFKTGNGFSDITIKKGVVSINFELLRGHFEHKFRFQNGNFELIGFSEVNSGGGTMTTIDFNLSTGVRIEKEERYDIDKLISYNKKKILIRPLPKLQDVEPFENELY